MSILFRCSSVYLFVQVAWMLYPIMLWAQDESTGQHEIKKNEASSGSGEEVTSNSEATKGDGKEAVAAGNAWDSAGIWGFADWIHYLCISALLSLIPGVLGATFGGVLSIVNGVVVHMLIKEALI